MLARANIFQQIPASMTEELVDVLSSGPGTRIERIVSRGQASPDGFWYDQDEDEFLLLLSGSATLSFQDQPPLDLGTGDYVTIPAHVKHRVERTDAAVDTVWLAVFHERPPDVHADRS